MFAIDTLIFSWYLFSYTHNRTRRQRMLPACRTCFTRQEPRDQFFTSMVGQFSTVERKSIEPIALQVAGGKVRAMQRLVSEALWDEAAMLETYHRLGQDERGEPDGVLLVDETGCAKKGHDSVGGARQ